MDDPVVGVAEVVDVDPLVGGTRGTGSVSIDRSRRARARTWLCSTLARIASGAVSLPRLRKTAVPGTTVQQRLPCRAARRRTRAAIPPAFAFRGDDLAAALPGGHDGERGEADEQRQPRAVDQLGEVRRDEQQVDDQQSAAADARAATAGCATASGRRRRTAAS